MTMMRGVDSSRLEAVYRERFADFLRIALAITRDEGLARDAVQEAFAKALRSSESFRAEASLDGWIWGILINVARSLRATKMRGLGQDATDVVLELDAEQGESEFRRWVATLPERQRLAIFLRYWVDLDYRSIAVALSVEVGTVSATLNAAHANLRRLLKEVAP
jgi:RNA polymerase sigma factor (sigma-70 family)